MRQQAGRPRRRRSSGRGRGAGAPPAPIPRRRRGGTACRRRRRCTRSVPTRSTGAPPAVQSGIVGQLLIDELGPDHVALGVNVDSAASCSNSSRSLRSSLVPRSSIWRTDLLRQAAPAPAAAAGGPGRSRRHLDFCAPRAPPGVCTGTSSPGPPPRAKSEDRRIRRGPQPRTMGAPATARAATRPPADRHRSPAPCSARRISCPSRTPPWY